jgi:hypothetical protein
MLIVIKRGNKYPSLTRRTTHDPTTHNDIMRASDASKQDAGRREAIIVVRKRKKKIRKQLQNFNLQCTQYIQHSELASEK